jgi:hypothetical protein
VLGAVMVKVNVFCCVAGMGSPTETRPNPQVELSCGLWLPREYWAAGDQVELPEFRIAMETVAVCPGEREEGTSCEMKLAPFFGFGGGGVLRQNLLLAQSTLWVAL